MTDTAPSRPSVSDPWIFLATAGGAGYLPKAPGTWGSVVAVLLAWPIMQWTGMWGLAVAAAAVLLLGVKATEVFCTKTGTHDPGAVVVDEVAGQWITLLACPLDPLWFLTGFIAFRVFDIAKPPPARQIDRSMSTAWGVMLDDVVAGVYGALVIFIIAWMLT